MACQEAGQPRDDPHAGQLIRFYIVIGAVPRRVDQSGPSRSVLGKLKRWHDNLLRHFTSRDVCQAICFSSFAGITRTQAL